MSRHIKIVRATRWQCQYTFPVLSRGGVCIAEEPCLLPRGHNGHHRGASGAVSTNLDGTLRRIDGDKR